MAEPNPLTYDIEYVHKFPLARKEGIDGTTGIVGAHLIYSAMIYMKEGRLESAGNTLNLSRRTGTTLWNPLNVGSENTVMTVSPHVAERLRESGLLPYPIVEKEDPAAETRARICGRLYDIGTETPGFPLTEVCWYVPGRLISRMTGENLAYAPRKNPRQIIEEMYTSLSYIERTVTSDAELRNLLSPIEKPYPYEEKCRAALLGIADELDRRGLANTQSIRERAEGISRGLERTLHEERASFVRMIDPKQSNLTWDTREAYDETEEPRLRLIDFGNAEQLVHPAHNLAQGVFDLNTSTISLSDKIAWITEKTPYAGKSENWMPAVFHCLLRHVYHIVAGHTSVPREDWIKRKRARVLSRLDDFQTFIRHPAFLAEHSDLAQPFRQLAPGIVGGIAFARGYSPRSGIQYFESLKDGARLSCQPDSVSVSLPREAGA